MRRGRLPLIIDPWPWRHRATRGVAFACVLATSAFADEARAQECRRPDIIDTIPDDGAKGVPTNAQPLARYRTIAQYLDEDISFSHVGVETFILKGTYNEAEGILTIVPPSPLEPDERYEVVWPELRGLGTATVGRGRTVVFTAGSREDTKPPSFGGILDIEWDVDRDRDECTDSVEERFDFKLELGKATDDGGRDLLMLVVFQTSGPDIGPGDPPKPVHIGKLPSEPTLHIKQAVSEAVGHVCFAAIVRDLTGVPSASGSKEMCIETVAPPFFYGCSVQPRSGTIRGELSLLALVLALGLRRRQARVHPS